MREKRVVITGMGVVSPVGLDIPTIWQNVIDGVSGIGPITAFDTTEFDTCIAGEVHGFDPSNYMTSKDARRMDLFVQYAVACLEEALAQSLLVIDEQNGYQVGANVGTGVGGIWTYDHEYHVLNEKGPRRVSPFLVPMIIVDAASVQIALRTGARGPNFGITSACATGADSIGLACETIRHGRAKVMITGGVEAAITPIGIATFDSHGSAFETQRQSDPEPAAHSMPNGMALFYQMEVAF